jgi:predicted nucleotidyltransferase component of viral defense system
LKIINNLQEKILRLFGQAEDSQKFYLSGGTALAYFYLHHRQSRDLDFFTSADDAVPDFGKNLINFLTKQGFTVENRRTMRSFCELYVNKDNDSTIIHMAQDSLFRFEPTKEFDQYPGLKVDSFTDIASNKLLALFGRSALRDFIDVYTLIQKGAFSKEKLIKLAKEKDPGFDLYWVGVAFTQIQDFKSRDLNDMLMLLEPLEFGDVVDFFIQWRTEIASAL